MNISCKTSIKNANKEPVFPKEEDFSLKKNDFFISFQPFCILTIPTLLILIIDNLPTQPFVSLLIIWITLLYFRKISLVAKYNKARYKYNTQNRLWDKQVEQETKKRQKYGLSYEEIIDKGDWSKEHEAFFLERSQYEKNISKMLLLIKARLGDDFQPLTLKKINQAYQKLQEIQSLNNVGNDMKTLSANEIETIVESSYFTDITKIIEIPKSGQKGKLAFLSSKGHPTTTEYACKEYLEQQGYKVMRAEVNFWQALFGIAFFEEIYSRNWDKINDIPLDMFTGGHFYNVRKELIDKKYMTIKNSDLKEFINSQISDFGFFHSRLLYNRTEIDIQYCKTPIVQEFLDLINSTILADIIYNIAQNVSENRAGLPDYIIWKNNEITLVEVKRLKEKIRDSQINWISFLKRNNVPVLIVRVKGI